MSTAPASPWDALLRAKQPMRVTGETVVRGVKPGTKTAELMAELTMRGSATTRTLAVCTDLTPSQVWGLLNYRRAVGEIKFEGGYWTLAAGFAGRDVERAAAVLRKRGWRVEAPQR